MLLPSAARMPRFVQRWRKASSGSVCAVFEVEAWGGPPVLRRPASRVFCSAHAYARLRFSARGELRNRPQRLAPAVRPSAASKSSHRLEELKGLLPFQGSRTLAGVIANSSSALFAATEATRKALGAHHSQASNPSIERTHNGEARLRASSMSAAPLCAAHVER